MRAVLGFLLLLLSGPVFSVALRGDNKPTPKNTLSPAFQQLKKQTPTDTASAATTDSTTASADPTTEQPTATAADQAATTTTATDTPTTTDTPATTDTGASVAETTATASNADLEAEQAKLNAIKDQIAEEQVKLDAIHASTLVTNPEMSGTKQYTDSMSNEQVDDLAKQVLTMPNLQAEDDKAKAASCAAPAAGATGAAGGAAAATAAAGGDAAATATEGGAEAGASDAEIMKKHQEFSTLIKHAQESIDEISAMPYLGQDSNKEAAALTCGAPAPTDTPKTEGDAASSAAAAAPAAATAAAAPAAATAAPAPAAATAATAAPAPAAGATGATGTASA